MSEKSIPMPADIRVGEDIHEYACRVMQERDSFNRMFIAACEALSCVDRKLGIPDGMNGGAAPIITAIEAIISERDELKERLGQSLPFRGEIVEIGDDENGQPRILIHGSREDIRPAASLFMGGTVTFYPSLWAKKSADDLVADFHAALSKGKENEIQQIECNAETCTQKAESTQAQAATEARQGNNEVAAPNAGKYFTYDGDNGFELCDTAEEARTASKETLRSFKDYAADDGEWPNETKDICWGVVIGSIHEIELPDDEYDGSQGVADYSKPVDYKLVESSLPLNPVATELQTLTDIPKGWRDEWKKNVMLLWACARKHDSSIPDVQLDFMRHYLLKAGEPCAVLERPAVGWKSDLLAGQVRDALHLANYLISSASEDDAARYVEARDIVLNSLSSRQAKGE